MKQLLTIFAVIFTLVFTMAPAEAKRFGGGKTFGKTYQVAPKKAPQKQQAPAADKSNATPASNTTKKGLMGGMLGGLLAGGLIGYLLGNGAFEGIQLADILLIGLAAFILMKLLKSKTPAQRQAAFETARGTQRDNFTQPPSQRQPLFDKIGGLTASKVPMNLPENFDLNSFLANAREHYCILQQAWDSNNFELIKEYVSTELYDALKNERAQFLGEQNSQVLSVEAELVRADYNDQRAEISLDFTGRYHDLVGDIEEDIYDTWHLERDLTRANAPWLIVGIEE